MFNRWPIPFRISARAAFSLIASTALALSILSQEAPIHHSVAGRVITRDGGPTQDVKVILSRQEGGNIGQKTLGYDGSFVFEFLSPGGYLLTIERPSFATIGRPIEIKNYSQPRTVVLDIRLKGNQAASIREVVKDYGSLPSAQRAEEKSKEINRQAGQAFLKASKEAAKGNLPKAIQHLQSAVQAQPDFFEAHYNLGVHYQALEQRDKAIQAYLRAIELRKNTAKPNFNLGVIYHDQGRLEQAIERYNKALEYDPSFAEAHQALGEALFQKHHYYSAEEHLETATRLAPARTKPSFGLLVKIQLLNKDPAQARYYLKQFIHHHGDDPVAKELQRELDQIKTEGPQGR